MPSVEVDGSNICLLGVLKGLVSETPKVEKAIAEFKPDAIGVSVSKEQLEAMRAHAPGSSYDLSELEHVYKTFMESFGEVRLPSPAYVEALYASVDLDIALIPIDMNDEVYTEVFCRSVGGVDLVREGFFARSISRKKFDLSSPERFALDWDKKVNRSKGFKQLEKQREEHMANTLRRMCKKYKAILAIVEFERAQGVFDLIETDANRK